MKLEGIRDGVLYASTGRTVLRERGDGSFGNVGTLPRPRTGLDGLRHELVTARPWKSALAWVVGAFPTTNVWRVGDGWLATAGAWLFASPNDGNHWVTSRRLPPSSGTAGVLPTGVCHHDGTTYLGEYPLDGETTPRILKSTNDGVTWETLLSLPDVRHVHAVRVDPYSGDRWVTTGDADGECWIGRLRGDGFEAIGGGSQDWRAVDLVFTPDAILWGVDCAYADENRIFALDRDVPGGEPRQVGTLDSSVYYGESIEVDGTAWAILATAAESGPDSSAPEESTAGPRTASVVAASAATGFTEWHELATYQKRTVPTDRFDPWGRLPSANAYVFLASDPERGLFLNPYNTASDHGRILRIPPRRFEGLADDTRSDVEMVV